MERKELHRRIELLKEKLTKGQLKFAPHLIDGFQKSLSKVKFLSDGIVDVETVDGRIRSLCSMIAIQNDRNEWKESISLKDIQESYFSRVEYAFGELYSMMIEYKVDPYQFSEWYCSNPKYIAEALPIIEEFLQEIQKFWENISEPTWIHLEDSFESKAIFTGEIFPDGYSNLASSTGIYFDTTILPDPFIKILPVLQFSNNQEKCYDIIRLALQLLSYKSLALADTEKPIVVILPDRHHMENNYKEFINACAVGDSIEHTKVLFGQDINNSDELLDYYSSFKNTDEVISKLLAPDKLVFATEWKESLNKQIERFIKEQASKLGMTKPGQAIYLQLISRFSQANDALQRSLQLRGTPIIRAETSWIWYSQMLEYNAGNSNTNDILNNLHVSRALNSTVKKEIPWIGNIPPDSLIELRKSGALDEIRHILSKGIKELIETNPNNFYRTGDKVFDNLNIAFMEHENKIKELSLKKWKFAGKDIGSFIITGGIEITAAITGLPLYGTLGAMASMTGVIPTVKDLKEKYRQLCDAENKVKNTGIGILFNSKSV